MLFALVSLSLLSQTQTSPGVMHEARKVVEESKRLTSPCGKPHQSASKQCPIAEEKRYPNLLVFVSFSMPSATLKSLAKQAREQGGTLVLRGLVDGSFPKTARRLKELGQEIMIDPTLFRAFGVTQVPTFVLTETPYTDGSLPRHHKLTGNVTVEHAIDKFSKNGGFK